MDIISTPEKFSPAYGDIIYNLASNNSSQAGIVDIMDYATQLKIGEKRLKGSRDYQVNLAAYVRSRVNINPLPLKEIGITTPGGRLIFSCIRSGNNTSWAPHTGGSVFHREHGTMSDAPAQRTICKGQQEEISIVAPGNILAKISFRKPDGKIKQWLNYAHSATVERLVVMALNTAYMDDVLKLSGDSLDNYEGIILNIYIEEVLRMSIEYKIEPYSCNTMRICWLNKYGAIDYFNFRNLRQEAVEIKKNRNFAFQGFQDSNRTITVTTPPGDREKMEWLGEIISSPKVWMAVGEKFIRVEVLTQKIDVAGEKLMPPEICFRVADNDLYQRL